MRIESAEFLSVVHNVEDVVVIPGAGPWRTKSDAELSVLFGLPNSVVQSEFFRYENDELAKIPVDIRGLRSYTVRAIPRGKQGADEWHKLRHELVFAIEGSVLWSCWDVFGQKREFTLNATQGIWVKPYILHAYEALEERSSLLVVANTLFFPDRPETHDTYSADSFRRLTAAAKRSA